MSLTDSERVQLSMDDARELAYAALSAIGYESEQREILCNHMLDAAMCGYEYSGLPKILQISVNSKRLQPTMPFRDIHATPVSVLIDGGNHSGMLAMHHATERAIEMAQIQGFALVGVTNSWMSGRSAYYVERIARSNLIGIHTVGSASLVAPPGASQPAYGTNPIAFGFPMEGHPLVIDVSTASFPGTELDFYQLLGLPLPIGVALDSQGQLTTDPQAAKLGALLPFGGHKGFALGMAMQALGVLAGSGLNASKDYGYLIIAMRPDLLLPLTDFKRDLSEMLARIKAVPRQSGVNEIRLPFESSLRLRERAMREGIAIDLEVHKRLLALIQTKISKS
jgi:LDH2 family malate/lactate/ureidoglycolate dehydrogenase